MRPKRKRTPWRRWRFRTAGMSNTPPALRWLFRETPLDRNRLPMIWNKRFPEDTFAKFTYVPVLRALSALERGSPTDSVEWLHIALPYELAVNGLNFAHFYLGGLHSAYVRGEALVAAHRYAEAAAEFQKILDHRGIVGADPIGALAHLQLGRTFVLAGRHGQSQGVRTGIFSLSGKTLTQTSRFLRKRRRSTPGCNSGSFRTSASLARPITSVESSSYYLEPPGNCFLNTRLSIAPASVTSARSSAPSSSITKSTFTVEPKGDTKSVKEPVQSGFTT